MPKAIVVNRWILTDNLGESVPYLKSASEDEWGIGGWIHGYQISTGSMGREQIANALKFNDPIEFRLWGFYGFKRGTALHNSGDIFDVHLRTIQNAISRSTNLGINSVKQHNDWQISENKIYTFGKSEVHVAQGTLMVDVTTQLYA